MDYIWIFKNYYDFLLLLYREHKSTLKSDIEIENDLSRMYSITNPERPEESNEKHKKISINRKVYFNLIKNLHNI